jgi:hypothetical protein
MADKFKDQKKKDDIINYQPPRQDLTDKQIIEQYGGWEAYDKQMVRYCCTFYNRPNEFYDIFYQQMPSVQSTLKKKPYSPVLQILENYRYYNGEQFNFNYAFLSKTVSGDEIPAPFIPGQKIYQIIEFLKGSYASVIRNAKIRCRSLSKQAEGNRYKILTLSLLKYEYRKLFDDMEEEGIMSLNPIPEDKLESKESIYKFVEENPFEASEKLGNSLLEFIVRDNDFTNKAIRSYFDTRVGRYSGMVCRILNGRIDIQTIPGYQLIIDNRVDDDLNSQARFRGIIEYLTPEEIFERYSFTKEERDEIIANAGGLNEFMAPFNSFSDPINFRWWSTTNRQIAVVTMYWMQLVDTRYVYKRDSNGKIKYPYEYKILPESDKRTGEFFVSAPRQATLIGNKYVRENRFVDDIVYHPNDKKQPLFPLHIICPNMVNGMSKSVVDRLRAHQDMHDAISLRIRDKMAKAHGKVPIIDGSQIQGVGPLDLEEDFKKLGFTVLNMASSEYGDPTVRPLVQYADFTMDNDVRALISLKQEEERLMNDMYNTSPIVMGTQQTYTGYGTQQSAISQATMSIVNDTQTHVQFLANVLQYSINVAKKFYTSKEGKKFAADLFNNRTLFLMDQTEDLRFEDLSAIVDILDNIDQAERKELMMLAQTIIPTGNLDALELMIDLQSQPTKTSLKNAIDYIISKKKREQQQQQEQMMMQQALMQDAAAQQQMEQQAMIEEGQMERENMKQEGAIEKELIKANVKTPPSLEAPSE